MVQMVQTREVELVNVEGLVLKRMVRRAQEAMKPLFWVWLDLYGSLDLIAALRERTYMIPCKKVAVKAILAETSMFRFQTTGSGIMSITAPVTTFGIAI